MPCLSFLKRSLSSNRPPKPPTNPSPPHAYPYDLSGAPSIAIAHQFAKSQAFAPFKDPSCSASFHPQTFQESVLTSPSSTSLVVCQPNSPSSLEFTEISPASPSRQLDDSTSSEFIARAGRKNVDSASNRLKSQNAIPNYFTSSNSHRGATPTTLTKELQEVFKKFDANGDGKISAYELRDVLRSLGDHATEEEAVLMLKDVHADADGYINLQEFIRVHTVPLDSNGEVASPDELEAAFHMFDLDRNGYITAEELRQVIINLGDNECTIDDCCMMIKGVDLDGDGRVNLEEFKTMMS